MLNMGMYRYVTNRTIKDKEGKAAGKIRVIVKEGSDTADVDYVCPECGFGGHAKQEWKRPFNVKCSKCGFVIKLARLKDEMKKDKKKRKK